MKKQILKIFNKKQKISGYVTMNSLGKHKYLKYPDVVLKLGNKKIGILRCVKILIAVQKYGPEVWDWVVYISNIIF